MTDLVRYAEWNDKLDEATERTMDRRSRRNNPETTMFLTVLFCSIAIALASVSGASAASLTRLGFLFLIALPLLLRSRTRHAASELLSRQESPRIVPQYPVDLNIVRDDLSLGFDEGIVTFCDGWLLFDGLRTSFSIRAADLDRWREAYGGILFGESRTTDVVLTVRGSQTDLLFRCQPVSDMTRSQFLLECGRFIGRNEIPAGEPVLPPIHPYPRERFRAARSASWLRKARWAVGVGGLAIVAMVAWRGTVTSSLPLVIATAATVGCASVGWVAIERRYRRMASWDDESSRQSGSA